MRDILADAIVEPMREVILNNFKPQEETMERPMIKTHDVRREHDGDYVKLPMESWFKLLDRIEEHNNMLGQAKVVYSTDKTNTWFVQPSEQDTRQALVINEQPLPKKKEWRSTGFSIINSKKHEDIVIAQFATYRECKNFIESYGNKGKTYRIEEHWEAN